MTTDELIDDILRREGGLVDHPADKGGITNRGITVSTLADYRGRPVTREEIRSLDEATARAIYRKNYVGPYEWIPNDRLRALCADYAVLFWHDNVARALQRAVSTTVDGVIGPETRERVVKAIEVQPQVVYRRVLEARLNDHFAEAFDHEVQGFLKAHPKSQLINLRGWILRSAEFAV